MTIICNMFLYIFLSMMSMTDSDISQVPHDTHNQPHSVKCAADTSLGDVIFELDVQTPTGDNQCLGVEFDGRYFYVTGANSSIDPNKIYVIDTLGNLIWEMYQPGHSTGWGWRDLCWDRVYVGLDRIDTLYASVNSNVDLFGIDLTGGNLIYFRSFSGPYSPNRALACEGPHSWFYSANFNTQIYRFKKTGEFDLLDNPYHMYGAAYDSDTVDGGWVWWHSQDDPGTGYLLQIEQIDTDPFEFTGLTFGYEPSIVSTGVAGGLCFYENFRGMDVLFALVQGSPIDIIVGIFIRWHDTDVKEIRLPEIPASFGFTQSMCNISSGITTISYTTYGHEKVILNIYDTKGRLIKTLVNEIEPAGSKHVLWDGEDNNHCAVSTGVYFLKLETKGKTDICKLILIK